MLFLLYYYDSRFVCIEFDYSNIKLILIFVVMDHSPHRSDYDHVVVTDDKTLYYSTIICVYYLYIDYDFSRNVGVNEIFIIIIFYLLLS